MAKSTPHCGAAAAPATRRLTTIDTARDVGARLCVDEHGVRVHGDSMARSVETDEFMPPMCENAQTRVPRVSGAPFEPSETRGPRKRWSRCSGRFRPRDATHAIACVLAASDSQHRHDASHGELLCTPSSHSACRKSARTRATDRPARVRAGKPMTPSARRSSVRTCTVLNPAADDAAAPWARDPARREPEMTET